MKHPSEKIMMKKENIRNYAQLMKELDLSALEITEGDKRIRLERSTVPTLQTAVVPTVLPTANVQTDIPAQEQMPAGKAIKSPMVGVFYRAPAENAEPFVKVGDTVKKGDVVGIIEAMKLMNEVISDVDGEIEEICASNAEAVDFGKILMKVK